MVDEAPSLNLGASSIEEYAPINCEKKIVKKEQQESNLRDALKHTFDSNKKAQAKMEQQILEVLLSTFDEKIQHNRGKNANPGKGRMHSNLKT